jgi:hypothetical protein
MRAPPCGSATYSSLVPRLSTLRDFLMSRRGPLNLRMRDTRDEALIQRSSRSWIQRFRFFSSRFHTSRLRELGHPTLALSSYETLRCEISNSDLFGTAPALTTLQPCKIQRLSAIRHFYLEVSPPSIQLLSWLLLRLNSLATQYDPTNHDISALLYEVSLSSISALFCARLDVHFRRPRSISLQLI